MHRDWIATVLGCLLGLPLAMQGYAGNLNPEPLEPAGLVQVDQFAEIKADERTVAEIVATFNRAELAVREQKLDALMELYSEAYQNHGLRKDDVRNIWAKLFAQYDTLIGYHLFSSIVVKSGQIPTADITCTGGLRGNSRDFGWRVVIDRWLFETHHLVFEDGGWRIRGHADKGAEALEFGSALHPLF